MKKILLSILILFSSFSLFAYDEPGDSTRIVFAPLAPEQQHGEVGQFVARLLVQNHYRKRQLDDSLSSKTFDRYLEKLDYRRLYFLESDIRFFEQYRYQFDDLLRAADVQPAYDIFNIYQNRLAERLEYVFERLNHEFDFTIDEYLEYDRDDAPWPKGKVELDELWRKYLKEAVLSLKLAGKDWESTSETVRKRYKRIKKNVSQYQSEDIFQILMNALSESFDPHTNYFSPKNFDNFMIQMSQSFEGIGARLSTEDDYTIVVEIVPGGPADKGNLLHVKDKITGVAQDSDGEMVDVIGWRIDDVVQLIRGKKGTTVRLQILKADAEPGAPSVTIAIVRDKVKIEDQAAKSDTIEIQHEGSDFKFGVIRIPAFYSDFSARQKGDPDYKSTTRDVTKLIQELKRENVDGIIVDLRRNGGGLLDEAVGLTGLFIDKGPVVQVRDTRGRVSVEKDKHPGTAYDGPLAVLIDHFSASASEIFTAAIQDYDRGIVIGSQSFGKGTVQRPIDLNRFIKNVPGKLGQVKLTIAKFYRIDGGSTQHVGVIPDITFPSQADFMEVGESSRENALLWDRIDPIRYDPATDVSGLVPNLEQRHNLRLANDADYAGLLERLEEFEERRKRNKTSLNEAVRKKEREEAEKKKDQNKTEGESTDSGRDSMQEKLKKDLLLKESARVLGDYILLAKK
ncbi:MAG: carboxy terminal-processing peptidase [bacterium]